MTVIPIFMGPASSVPGRGAPDTDIVGVSTFGNALASAVDGSEKVAVPAGNIDSKQDSDGQPVNHAQEGISAEDRANDTGDCVVSSSAAASSLPEPTRDRSLSSRRSSHGAISLGAALSIDGVEDDATGSGTGKGSATREMQTEASPRGTGSEASLDATTVRQVTAGGEERQALSLSESGQLPSTGSVGADAGRSLDSANQAQGAGISAESMSSAQTGGSTSRNRVDGARVIEPDVAGKKSETSPITSDDSVVLEGNGSIGIGSSDAEDAGARTPISSQSTSFERPENTIGSSEAKGDLKVPNRAAMSETIPGTSNSTGGSSDSKRTIHIEASAGSRDQVVPNRAENARTFTTSEAGRLSQLNSAEEVHVVGRSVSATNSRSDAAVPVQAAVDTSQQRTVEPALPQNVSTAASRAGGQATVLNEPSEQPLGTFRPPQSADAEAGPKSDQRNRGRVERPNTNPNSGMTVRHPEEAPRSPNQSGGRTEIRSNPEIPNSSSHSASENKTDRSGEFRYNQEWNDAASQRGADRIGGRNSENVKLRPAMSSSEPVVVRSPSGVAEPAAVSTESSAMRFDRGSSSVETPRVEVMRAREPNTANQPSRTEWVTLRLDNVNGEAARVRVAVRGDHVRTTIIHPDEAVVETLRAHLPDLQQALSKEGLIGSRIGVQSASSQQNSVAPGSGGSGAGTADGGPSSQSDREGEGRDRPGQNDRNDAEKRRWDESNRRQSRRENER